MNFIDLGLPSGLKWADCNLGASKPEEFGDYYMYGSIKPNNKDNCSKDSAPFFINQQWYSDNLDEYWIKYNGKDGIGTLECCDDVAYLLTRGRAFIPTKENCEELLNKTTNEWVKLNGVYGRKFMSKTNSNSIFIPASGYCYDSALIARDKNSCIMTSTLSDDCYFSYQLFSTMNYVSILENYRDTSFPIRPVSL